MAMAPSASAVSACSASARPAVMTGSGRPRAAVSVGAVRVPAGGAAAAKQGGKWWAPLVGWSGRADYIEPAAPASAASVVEEEEEEKRSFVGGLTEEKARQLRARMVEMDSFHDAMYHSAIASRLARSAT